MNFHILNFERIVKLFKIIKSKKQCAFLSFNLSCQKELITFNKCVFYLFIDSSKRKKINV